MIDIFLGSTANYFNAHRQIEAAPEAKNRPPRQQTPTQESAANANNHGTPRRNIRSGHLESLGNGHLL
ncbi:MULTISPECIES: hypothetical protein [Pseudomonas]|uniref:Uncharacterized protein n=2 Tax=Pseudomonas TaxID=286 RepID=A0A5M9IPL4_9PSED|nr:MULTISPECIES: hypothetical protein [Pseudomonas]KAA6170667.1 hypothetical protein F3K54_23890 [Pseudomonas veronii]KAA6181419.1 hypothetical protein F3K53_10310 [Pseudomonas veronii]KAA8558497.1 hypothetical protein FX985_04855 [Pseudomonas extremaustralis]